MDFLLIMRYAMPARIHLALFSLQLCLSLSLFIWCLFGLYVGGRQSAAA